MCGVRTPLGRLSRGRSCRGLGCGGRWKGSWSWNTANDAVLAEGKRVLINDPERLHGVTTVGVDEHVWRHTRRGDKYVTVIIDLTPIRENTGPARLLDMVEGRSKQAFKRWLVERDHTWRDRVEVVAMDGFTGFKAAAAEELPDAVTVMDPFHVVRLAGATSWPVTSSPRPSTRQKVVRSGAAKVAWDTSRSFRRAV